MWINYRELFLEKEEKCRHKKIFVILTKKKNVVNPLEVKVKRMNLIKGKNRKHE